MNFLKKIDLIFVKFYKIYYDRRERRNEGNTIIYNRNINYLNLKKYREFIQRKIIQLKYLFNYFFRIFF